MAPVFRLDAGDLDLRLRPGTRGPVGASESVPRAPRLLRTGTSLMLQRLSLALLSLLLLCVSAPTARAQGSAREYLETRHAEIDRVLRRPSSPARAARLQELLEGLLDYDALSRRSLGEQWEAHTEEERAEFTGLLRQLVERNYEANLQQILDYRVSYDEERASDGETQVVTVARHRTQRRQPPIEIVYTVRRDGRRWQVVDVATDGVSMVTNYRRQFARIIRRDGWPDLLERMRRRLQEEG
jgi:phospholipid transport system substrate-binding protein